MTRTLRDNGLGIVFGLLFLGSLVGQAVSGQADHNNQQVVDGAATVSLGQYVTSSDFAVDFAVDVAENWQSEHLQFFLFILATVWLIQRGSPESKPPERIGPESDEDQQLGEPPPRTRRSGPARAAGAPRCSPTPSAS